MLSQLAVSNRATGGQRVCVSMLRRGQGAPPIGKTQEPSDSLRVNDQNSAFCLTKSIVLLPVLITV